MSFFPNAQNFQIQGGEFHSVQINQNFHSGQTGIDILLAASTQDAAVDAEARRYAPSCFPGTREQYIDDITNWATTPSDQLPPIYWMRGPAGVGKSAIAQTCAEITKEAGQLGAAFFFSVNGRDDHRRLFPTLAYQLSTSFQEYRQVLNDKILSDKSIVTKIMSSQFEALFVRPLKELLEQGKGVRRMTIFIDGLDECASKDAQEEIIRIVAASVQAESTPFRWAIFSRPESQIATTFDDERISSISHCVELPISRDIDQEIELYLRATFENMLRRRKLLHLAKTWPTNEDIKMLVDASAGLFAYPAAVLRFIDQNSLTGFMDRLQTVIYAIHQPNVQPPGSPFNILDAFYILVMKRIPKDILQSVLLFLTCVVSARFGRKSIAAYCNVVGLCQADFVRVMDALQAVMTVGEAPGPPPFDRTIDITRSYFVQHQCFQFHPSLFDQLLGISGRMNFYHKSFYDFLTDPTRSSAFCVTTPAALERVFDCYIRQHHHYAKSYSILDLALTPRVPSSPSSLSWPQGIEFVDSFTELLTFEGICHRLYFFIFSPSFWSLSPGLLQKFTELDYRKYLLAATFMGSPYLHINFDILGLSMMSIVRRLDGSEFRCIPEEHFGVFDPVLFLARTKKLEETNIIRRYHHRIPSTLTPAYRFLSGLGSSWKSHGQYKFGRGEKSMIWYWEFDTEKQYFHEFRTVNFLQARRIYETEKFKMWDESWVPPP